MPVPKKDSKQSLLSLATAEDKKKARSYVTTRAVQLGLAFDAVTFPEDLNFKAIARDFQISERRARQLFKAWQEQHRNASQ